MLVSSTRIRNLLSEGEVAEAAGLLGYRYRICGEVIHGKKLGRTLGFPTANMALAPQTSLKHGIYAVRFRLDDAMLYDGVASFGRRPTVDDEGAPLLETFLFDFSGDLYGKTAAVSFFGFLRGEVKFDGLDPLIDQMKQDEAQARARFSPMSGLSRGSTGCSPSTDASAVPFSRLIAPISGTTNIFRGGDAVLLRPASLFLQSSLLKASP